MKKLILAFCLLCTSSIFAQTPTPCTFNLTFNHRWADFTNWIVIVTDISHKKTHEAVGGKQLSYGKYPSSGKLTVTVHDCSKNTRLGFFGHAPGQPAQKSDLSNDDSNLNAHAYNNNFLEGMTYCVGDMLTANPNLNLNDIPLTVGSVGTPANPNNFVFGQNGEMNHWTKAQFGITCKNTGPLS